MRRLFVVAVLLGCGTAEDPAPVRDASPARLETPADSLALRLGTGTEIWFMEGRLATDTVGTTCYERTLEIRDSAGRRKVPLLYTLEAPIALDERTVRARVYLRCVPGDAYRIDLATGRPTRVTP
jgi:hypothetical protein